MANLKIISIKSIEELEAIEKGLTFLLYETDILEFRNDNSKDDDLLPRWLTRSSIFIEIHKLKTQIEKNIHYYNCGYSPDIKTTMKVIKSPY